MAYRQYRPAEISDFSGGMTDDYVNAPTNAAENMENFFVLENKSLRSRYGTELDDSTNPQIPAGAQRVSTLINYNNSDKLFSHSAKKLYYRDPSAYTTLLGPTGNDVFSSGDANTYINHTQWNKHLYVASDGYLKLQKIYKDGAGDYQIRTAGLPALASAPTVPNEGGGTNSYIYAFYYSYTYTAGLQTFIDNGPVVEVQVTRIDPPDTTTVAITAIPVLANGATDNYDTTVITVQIYRTISGGTELYNVGSVTNGTTIFNDTVSDSLVQDNASIYTTGDIPDNDPPPLSLFVHTVNNYTYYGNFKEGSDTFNTKIRQSQISDPDSVPTEYEDELEDEIKGISSVQEIPIVACEKHIYRIDGTFDLAGRGGMSHIRISDHAGCISANSMVQAEAGLFWAGNDGFYYTDGYKVVKISDHLNSRYETYLDTLATASKHRKIQGVFDEKNRRIQWTFSRNTKAGGSEETDIIWTCDLRYGVSENMTFYIWVGGDSFIPTSLAVFDGELYRGDAKGYVLAFRENLSVDPKIDVAAAPADWNSETIIYKYTSMATNFGTNHVRKFANYLLLSCKNESNVSIGITAINDDGRKIRPLKEIRWRRNLTWGDEEFIWGDTDFVWNFGGMIEQDRRMPAGGLRFNYLQMEITNSYTNVINSDNYGTATTNGVAKTATLNNASQNDWLTNSVDYYISFSSNSFATEHKIISRTPDTIVYQDLGNVIASSATQTWQIKGYRKSEVINILSYAVSWAYATRSNTDYSTGSSGNLA